MKLGSKNEFEFARSYFNIKMHICHILSSKWASMSFDDLNVFFFKVEDSMNGNAKCFPFSTAGK